MYNSKVISLLRTFSAKEWKAFEKYLQSSYLNSNKRLPSFYLHLEKHHPAFAHFKLTKPNVFTALFPEKKNFDDRLLRALMADLHKAAESFLAFEQLKQDGRNRSKMLIRSYGERGSYERFEHMTNDLLATIDGQDVKSMEDYLDAFLLNRNHYFHPRTEALTTAANTLKNAMKRLDDFYALAKLRLSCELSVRSKIVAEQTNYPLLEPVCEHIENSLLDENPAFGIYLNLLKINQEGLTEKLFYELKNNYLSSRNSLNFLEQKELLIYLINYGYRLAQNGKKLFFNELFELYQIGLKSGLLLEKGILPDIRFTNIAVVGSTIHEWTKIKTFIQKYAPMLEPDLRNDALALAWAFFYFHKGEYFIADEFLQKISTNKISYRLRQQSLSIRCLYEIAIEKRDYVDVLNSRIDSFEKYLSRQKIFSKESIIKDINFIRLLKKMVASLAKNQSPKHLKKEMGSMNLLTAKWWFLSKIK